MSKLMAFLSIVFLAGLYIGTKKYADYPLFTMATGSQIYQYVRLGLIGILAIQMVTRPPRHLIFRILSGSISIYVGVWAIYETYINQMLVLDFVTFLAAAVVIAIITLESSMISIFDKEIKNLNLRSK